MANTTEISDAALRAASPLAGCVTLEEAAEVVQRALDAERDLAVCLIRNIGSTSMQHIADAIANNQHRKDTP